MGAWIETNIYAVPPVVDVLSLPIWERGLKHFSSFLAAAAPGRSLYGSVD